MNYKDIVNQLREQLSGDNKKDQEMLQKRAEEFAKAGDYEGLKAAGEIIMEILPAGTQSEVYRLTHLDGERLDEVHQRIVNMIKDKDIISALPLAEKLYKKITLDFGETDTAKFVSLRNPFEDNLCQILFPTEKVMNRTPFDFCTFITTYAYLLVENNATTNAIPVLEKAISYNPVDPGPRFELAEIYKINQNKKMVIEVTRDTLAIASSPVAIARCYANVAYALTDVRELDDAAVFYFASVRFAPHPAIHMELKNLADMKGSPIINPTQKEIIDTVHKYDLEYGPSRTVIEVASSLSNKYLSEGDRESGLKCLKILYNLTLDPKIKDTILKLEPDAPMVMPSDNNA